MCRFGVGFRVWGEGARAVLGLGTLGRCVRPGRRWQKVKEKQKREGDPSKSDVLWGTSPLHGAPPSRPCGPHPLPVKVSPRFIQHYTYTLHYTTQRPHTPTHRKHPHHAHMVLLLPAPPPAHAGPCKPCRTRPVPPAQDQAAGFWVACANYRFGGCKLTSGLLCP